MKTTPFTKYHIADGAKMSEFAGYNMPIEFTGINEERLNVREKAGVFDVSHMGEISIEGTESARFPPADNDVSNNVVCPDPMARYSTRPCPMAAAVSWTTCLYIVLMPKPICSYVDAANIAKDYDHIVEEGKKFGLTAGKEIYNASDEICQSSPYTVRLP